MRDVDLVIKNGTILTQDEAGTIHPNGAIAVHRGRIEAVGPLESTLRDYRGQTVIDAARKAVLPGFVNTHFHFTQNFMKGTRDNLPLIEWIDKVSFPRIKVTLSEYRKGRADLHKLAALHAGIDLISSGITCTANMEWGMRPTIREAYDTLGMRIVNILTLTDVDSWTPKEAIIETDEAFRLSEELIEHFAETRGKVTFAYGIACPNSASADLIRRARREASDRGVRLHIHLAETRFEYDSFMKQKKVTPTRYLEDLGFWADDVWAAHSIWLDEPDVDILARRGVGVSHNPKCNMKIASGVAPVARMREKGVRVGIGVDSCAVSDNTDFFEAMRTMILLQRVHTMDPGALLGKEGLRMATIEGAETLGMADRIGSLEAGKQADILLVNLTDVNTRPYNDITNNLVFAANSGNIDTVIVGGEVLYSHGVFTRFDKESLLDEVEAAAASIYRAAGIELPDNFAINS